MANTWPHSPADVVRWLLIAKGTGTDPAAGGSWPVYAAREPDLPDNCVTVYDTAGLDDGRTMNDGRLQSHDGFQVRVRSLDHATGWAKADEIQTLLAEDVYDDTVTVGARSYLIHCAARIGDVLALGKEVPHTKRSLFTVNAVLTARLLA